MLSYPAESVLCFLLALCTEVTHFQFVTLDGLQPEIFGRFLILQKPSSVRVDQLDRTKLLEGEQVPPLVVHFGIRPAQLSYAGDPA